MACRLESRAGIEYIEYMTGYHRGATLRSARMRESLGLHTNHQPSLLVLVFTAPSLCVSGLAYVPSDAHDHRDDKMIESEDSHVC